MKLIDADARVTVQSFDVEHEEYEYIEMSVAEALDFATNEGCPPAVDVIPVEWVETLLKEWLKGSASFETCGAIAALLARWQKEQEER